MRKEKQYSKKSYFITHGAVLAILLILCILAKDDDTLVQAVQLAERGLRLK